MVPSVILIVVIIAVVVATLYGYDFGSAGGRPAISSWALQNGYRVAKIERRDFLRGPFFISPSFLNVYRVTIEEGGAGRIAWILMSFRHKILKVRWEDERGA